MILLDNVGSTPKTMSQSTTQMTIKASAKAYSLIYEDLYSDKKGAVVRELACNAFDSHVAAGKSDIPIEIKFPTVLDTTFYVKDFGVGMSLGDVETVYTNIFNSTKENDNDAIGALGIGSKAPFAYTDSFTLTSGYDGVTSVYSVYKSKGIPHLDLVTSYEDTYNGVTVSFNVLAADISDFKYAGLKILNEFTSAFDYSGFELAKKQNVKNYFFKVKGHKVRLESYEDTVYEKSGLVMGNICYGLSYDFRKFTTGDYSFRLHVPIGVVSFMPSRESLDKECQETKEFLEELYEQFKFTLQNEFEKDLGNVRELERFSHEKELKERFNIYHLGLKNDNSIFESPRLENTSIVLRNSAVGAVGFYGSYISINKNYLSDIKEAVLLIKDDLTPITRAIRHVKQSFNVLPKNLVFITLTDINEDISEFVSELAPLFKVFKTSELSIPVQAKRANKYRGCSREGLYFSNSHQGILKKFDDVVDLNKKYCLFIKSNYGLNRGTLLALEEMKLEPIFTTNHKFKIAKQMLDCLEASDLAQKYADDSGIKLSDYVRYLELGKPYSLSDTYNFTAVEVIKNEPGFDTTTIYDILVSTPKGLTEEKLSRLGTLNLLHNTHGGLLFKKTEDYFIQKYGKCELQMVAQHRLLEKECPIVDNWYSSKFLSMLRQKPLARQQIIKLLQKEV